MRAVVSCVLMIVVLGLTTNAAALAPAAISPGGENGMTVISQECPTFSRSEGRGLGVEVGTSTGMKEALKETESYEDRSLDSGPFFL